ncbi:MFS transporter [Aestuariispira insulae]|uniref:Putative MFS family arabinose efflux permease n=1 Tax=Aestuariispira insulae TaxID=1461337 RepID=A0A3D9HSA0_9PROT|nr:MFS transporter [Aestuariispira insulae]RED52372.1 putative MFS family arabinose efflux permease [Aestuariispira insulae]
MFPAIRSSWPLLVGIALLMISNGTLLTLLGVRATLEGFTTTSIGLVMSGYSLGQLAGCVAVPRILENSGHVRVFAAFASLASIAALVHMIYVDPWIWGAMRMLSGFCYAGLYVVAESWLNDQAENKYRGQLLSVYFITQTASFALGQFLLNYGDPAGIKLFVLVSILTSLALVPILLSVTRSPSVETPVKISIPKLMKLSTIGVGGCFLNGVFLGGFYSMGFVYAREIGLSSGETASFMGFSTLAAILFQYPIGRISDAIDRRWVIAGAALLSGLFGLPLSLFPEMAIEPLYLFAGMTCGLALPIYSLSIAHTNDHLNREEIISASSRLVLIFGSGLVIGPYISTLVVEIFGAELMFFQLAAVQLLVALLAISRLSHGRPAAEDQGAYATIAPGSTPVSMHLIPEGENLPPADKGKESDRS